MAWISGRNSATQEKTIQFRESMLTETPSATATSTITEPGRKIRPTATSGLPTTWALIGLLIAMEIGTMSRLGAGLGLAASLGDLLHITMAAGTISVPTGAGALGRFGDIHIMDRPSSVSWAALVLDSALAGAVVSAGSRLDGESRSIRGTTAAAATITTSTSTTPISTISILLAPAISTIISTPTARTL